MLDLTPLFVEIDAVRTLIRSRETQMARVLGLGRAASQLILASGSSGGTVPQLARKLALTRQSVQRVADALVESRLATYEPNSNHRRSPRLVLSSDGHERRRALERGRVDLVPDLSDDLEDDEVETAVQVLRTIRASL